MKLEDKQSGTKYIAYAYRIDSDFKLIKNKLEREIQFYQSIGAKDNLADIEDVFTSDIHEKKYIVFTRKYRESQTFYDIAANPELKSSLDVLNAALIIAKSMEKL